MVRRNDAAAWIKACAAIWMALMLCACGDILWNAKTGNIKRIQAGLDSGVSINKIDHLGNTPLMLATLERQHQAIEFLCQKGADINARNNNGATALILAVYYRDYETASVLMRCNPDTSIRDQFRNRAIDYAREYYDPRMHALLKE